MSVLPGTRYGCPHPVTAIAVPAAMHPLTGTGTSIPGLPRTTVPVTADIQAIGGSLARGNNELLEQGRGSMT